MQSIKLHDIHYNQSVGVYEARVDVIRNNDIFRYPCSLRAPANLADDKVRLGLIAQALRMSDTPRPTKRPSILEH